MRGGLHTWHWVQMFTSVSSNVHPAQLEGVLLSLAKPKIVDVYMISRDLPSSLSCFTTHTCNISMSDTTALVRAVGSWFGGLATHLLALVLNVILKPVLRKICPQGLRKYFSSPPLASPPPLLVNCPPLISDASIADVIEKFDGLLKVGGELTDEVGNLVVELRLLREQGMGERTFSLTIGAGTSPVVPANTT